MRASSSVRNMSLPHRPFAPSRRGEPDRAMMNPVRKILTLTMSGLVTVLPVTLTIYVIWWLVHTVEEWLRRVLIALQIVSPAHYWPGLGLIAGFFLLLLVGSLVNAYAGKILLKYWD